MATVYQNYVKHDVDNHEYLCNLAAVKAGLAPEVVSYDPATKIMTSVKGIGLHGFGDEMSQELAKDIATLVISISKSNLKHVDFHVGNMVYLDNKLLAIDWDRCDCKTDGSSPQWQQKLSDMVEYCIRTTFFGNTTVLSKGRAKIKGAVEAQLGSTFSWAVNWRVQSRIKARARLQKRRLAFAKRKERAKREKQLRESNKPEV